VLPPEAQIAFDGQSKEYLETSGGMILTLVFALLIVYLVLAAQFESWIDPVTIMLTVPLSVTGALGSVWFAGVSLNIYTQIGLILLVGLMAKNGILIVEFANQLRDRGLSVREAALEGSVRRLRPILMTTLATVLGAVPLMISTGAGAESRSAIGLVIVGGFGFASLLTLVVTPVLYDLLSRLTKPRAHQAQVLENALAGSFQPAE
jgi:multidrug efflux pump